MTPEQDGLLPHPRGEQGALSPERDAGEPAVSSLNTPPASAPGTASQVRDDLQELVRRDLLGPWDGDAEECPPRAMGPRERYLIGMIGPKQRTRTTRARATAVSDVDDGVQADGSEAELPEVITPQNLGKMWAASMGLSFAVPTSVAALAVTASWGRYLRRETKEESGRTRSVWTRQPVSYPIEVRLDGAESYQIPLTMADPGEPGVLLAVEVRPREGRRVVQLALVNTQLEPETNSDTAWLFQCGLTVTAPDGAAAVFLPIDDPADDLRGSGGDLEDAHLRLLYRSQRRYASGRNVAVHAEVRDGERCAYKLATTWLPVYDVPDTVAEVGEGSRLAGVELSMDALAEADPDTLRAGLAPLADGYVAWLDQQEAAIPALPVPLRAAAESAVFQA